MDTHGGDIKSSGWKFPSNINCAETVVHFENKSLFDKVNMQMSKYHHVHHKPPIFVSNFSDKFHLSILKLF